MTTGDDGSRKLSTSNGLRRALAQSLLCVHKRVTWQAEELFFEAMHMLLEKKCPKRRLRRRNLRKEQQEAKNSSSEPEVTPPATVIENQTVWSKSGSPSSRHIPIATRDFVLERDGYRCTFVSGDRNRCNCQTGLELDHIFPFSLGGGHDASNLRVRCQVHNMLEAQRQFGKQFMATFSKHIDSIDERILEGLFINS